MMALARSHLRQRFSIAALRVILMVAIVAMSGHARAQGANYTPFAAQAVVQAPGSIVELARALKNDPDLIFQYVYNNIEYTPMFGSKKGPLGTLLDGRGDDFDQSALMVALLRQAGYTASFLYGQIVLFPVQAANLLGVDVTTNACTASGLLFEGGIPVSTSTSDGTCAGTLNYVLISHVWVKAIIGGTAYVFDPSYKVYDYTAGINLASAMGGYSQSSFLSAAESGTTITSNSIQNVNRANLRSTIASYANSLTNYIKTNIPAASLDQVIGGRKIDPNQVQHRDTSLPYQIGTPIEWTGDIDVNYKTQVSIQMSGWSGTSWTSDVLYGRRLTIVYNASNQPVLNLDGVPQATGTAGTSTLTVTVTHPFAGATGGSFQQVTQQTIPASPGNTFFVVNGYDDTGPGMIDVHRRALLVNQANGNSSTSEPVLGETLAVAAFTYLSEFARSNHIVDQLADTQTVLFQVVGVVGQATAPYIDLPGGVGHTSLRGQCTGPASAGCNNDPLADATFFDQGASASAFEWGTVEQTMGVGAVSTIKLIDIANAAGMPIFDANSTNFASTISPQLHNYSTTDMTSIQNAINGGQRVILPQNGNLTQNSWTGAGYLTFSVDPSTGNDAIGYVISQNLKGGYADSLWSDDETTLSAIDYSTAIILSGSSITSTGTLPSLSREPVDLFSGNYLYEHDDLTIGSAAFPLGLDFDRSYNTGARGVNGPLGLGWSHNLSGSATVSSDPLRGMSDSPIDAAPVIASLYASLDILNVATAQNVLQIPLDRYIVSSLIHRYTMDQLLNDIVNIIVGSTARQFRLLPDGSYNAPPAISDTLTLSGGTYTYKTKQGITANFNGTGQLTTYQDPAGPIVTYNYTGNQLTSVGNNLGWSLTFSYDGSNRILTVTDNTGRHSGYTYDTSGNLATYTDAAGKVTTYSYDLPGRLTQIFYPSFPTTPFVTNTYDTLDRVETQVNANNSPSNNTTYTYYLAGFRSEEVDPNGFSHILYNNALGNMIIDVDRMGNTTQTVYDGRERKIRVTLPEGILPPSAGDDISYTYDDSHDPLTINIATITTSPKWNSTLPVKVQTFTYDPVFNKVTSATDALGLVTTSTYDPATGSLLTTTTDSGSAPHLNATHQYTYNSFGQKLTDTDPMSVVTKYAYDGSGNLTSTTRDYGTGHLNQVTSMGYDSVGNVTSMTDPNGHVTTTAYDSMRRPTQVTLPAPSNLVATSTYDLDGRVVRVQKAVGTTVLSVTSATYTPSGQRATAVDENGNTTTYAYDLIDRLKQVTDPENRVTSTAYDADSRLSQILNTAIQAQPLEQHSYTPDGVEASFTDARGNVTAYTYDGFNRKSETTYPDTSLESWTYDADDNILTQQTRAGQTITYAYDTLNRKITKTPPSPAPVVSYAYDLNSRLTGVHDNSTTIHAVAVPGGGSGVRYTTFYYYDAVNRMTGVDWDTVNTPVVPPTSYAVTEHWYNKDKQRVFQTTTDNGYWYYPSTGSGTTNYTTNAMNQYTTVGTKNPTYDTNGNLTSDGTFTYTYDTENRLATAVGAGNTASYTYDAQGHRKSKTVNGTTTFFVWDGDREVMEYDGGTGNILHRFVYGNGLDEALSIVDSSGNRTTPVPDIQGSRIALIDGPSGTVSKAGYLPYGESADATGAFRYTGRRIDAETKGLYYYRARMYDPVLGRFMQADPVGYSGGKNLYAYVGNDPLNLTDPSGKDPFIGLTIGLISGAWYGAWGAAFSPDASLASILAGAGVGAVVGGGIGLADPSFGVATYAIVGAAAGFAGDLASQAITNHYQGRPIADVNWGSAIGAGVGGAISGVGGGLLGVAAKGAGLSEWAGTALGASITAGPATMFPGVGSALYSNLFTTDSAANQCPQ